MDHIKSFDAMFFRQVDMLSGLGFSPNYLVSTTLFKVINSPIVFPRVSIILFANLEGN